MTRLHAVRAHVRRSPAPSEKRAAMLDRLQFEVAFLRLEDFRVDAMLEESLEEALADWRPEEK